MAIGLKYILPFWSAIGVCTVLGLMQWNGTYKQLLTVNETNVYPKTDVFARHDFTGIKRLDDLLRSLNTTFWPIIDGSFPAASLQNFHFAGAYGATWTLLFLESIRAGNQWKAASFITIAGVVGQLASYGVTIPLYLTLQLWTSPTVSGAKRDTILVHPLQAKLVPYSIILGYIVPVVMLLLPSPSAISLERKQTWLALWNAFPVLVTFVHFILSTLGGAIFPQPKYTAYTNNSTLSSTRSVYAFAFSLATITHIVSWSMSLSSLLFPALYSPGIVGDLNPARVFLPIISYEHTEWPLGIHRLLQWDNFVGSTAVLAWAAVLLSNAYRVSGTKSHLPLALKLFGFSITSGFVGAAAVLQWERDEVLLTEDRAARKKQ